MTRTLRICLLLVAGIAGSATAAQAAQRQWQGADGASWSVDTNWLPNGPLADGDELVFPSGGSNSSVNDIVGPITYASLTFEQGHSVSGTSAIALDGSGGIHVVAGEVIIDNAILVVSAQTWTVDDGASLRTDGTITLSSVAWTLTGGTGTVFRATDVIGGDGTILKAGRLSAQFAALNTFAGPLTIEEGELVINNPAGLGVADGTAENGTIVQAGGQLKLEDVAAFNEALTLNGTGVGNSGALVVANIAAPLAMNAPVTLATSASVNADAGAPQSRIDFNGPIEGPGNLQIDDTTIVVLFSTENTFPLAHFVGTQDGTLRLGAADTLPAPVEIIVSGSATLDLFGFSTTLASLSGTGTVTTTNLPVAQLTLDMPSSSTFSGTIGAGIIKLVKKGAGELTLAGANAHPGDTVVESGNLRVTHASGLGSTVSGTQVTGNGRLVLEVSVGAEALRLTKLLPADQPRLHVGTATPITLAGRLDVDTGGVITGDPGSILTMDGLIYAPEGLVIAGVALHANNQFNTIIGQLFVINGGAYDILTDSASMDNVSVSLANGGTLALNGTSLRVTGLSGTGGILSLGTNGTLEVAPSVPSVYAGSITGTGTLTKSFTQPLTLAGATTFTGAVNVTSGDVILAHEQALAAAAITVSLGGSLQFTTANTHTGALTIFGFGTGIGSAALQVLGGNVTISGPSNLGAIAAPQPVINVAAPHQLTFAGPVTGDQVYLLGGGTTVFASTGNVIARLNIGLATPPLVGGGTVRLGVANAFATMVPLTIDTGATFDAGGHTVTLTDVSGNGTIHTGTASGSVTLEGAGTAFLGTFAGAGAIVINAGQFSYTLNGTHTLTGSLTVHGSLFVKGTIPASVHVDGQFMDMDSGTSVGALTFGQSTFVTIDDDSSTNGVTTGSLTLRPDTLLALSLTATTPRISAHGTVTLAGDLSAIVANGVAPGVFTLIDNDGTDPVVGTFEDLPEGAIQFFQNVGYRISYVGGTGNDVTLTPPLTSYHLSEGATGSFFDTDLLIANPSHDEVEVTVTFLPEGGTPIEESYFLDPMTRETIHVKEVPGLESASFSTIVKPDVDVPLVVERTMRWDQSGYGAHTEKATNGPATTWYFAEGSEGFFRTFLLLANPHTTANVARVTWLREGTTPVERTYDLAPTSRHTIAALDDPELVNTSFGIKVTFDQPGVAERAMYFGMDPAFTGGHESAGATETSTTWLLAEGATGSGFDTFILVSNPNAEPADVTFTFLPESGPPASITRTVAAASRITINPEAESLAIPEGPLGTQVTATQPVIAERAQYWPLGPSEWTEAHNSFGVTAAATKWGLAEGRAGGPLGYQTYILLANPGTTDATVTLTFLEQFDTVPAPKTVVVPAQRRVNVFVEPVPTEDEEDEMEFGTLIVSDQPIVVERAMYWNVGGVVWAAGTNATATRLP